MSGLLSTFASLERIEAHCVHLINYSGLLPPDLGFRLCPASVVECLLEQFCIFLPVLIENVGVLIRNHGCLRMTGVALYGLDVTLIQLQFIGDAGVAETVKDNRRQVVFFDQVLQRLADLCGFARQSDRCCDHQIEIGVFVADGFQSLRPAPFSRQ